MARFAIAASSNPPSPRRLADLARLEDAAHRAGHSIDRRCLDKLATTEDPWRWNPKARADFINEAAADPGISAILDITGGNLANEILSYLDWPTLVANHKLVVGYSDISCILGALPHRTLLWNPLLAADLGFAPIDEALQGKTIRPHLTPIQACGGTHDPHDRLWAGGNIRCFLKLAGTPWWPNLDGTILLIEGLAVSLEALAAYLGHHRTLGTFEHVEGIVVGQLTRIDNAEQRNQALSLICEYAPALPIWEAPTIGHSADSGAVTLG
ncbi:LD-carboxypeptidase [Arcanobacterium haemolyticum]|nr:LD-carboxypeptidase [Arcanobacterium haemolyticum]